MRVQRRTAALAGLSIAFGIVHGCSGWLDRVCDGGGPERSIPNRRRLVMRGLIPLPLRAPAGLLSRSGQAAPELGHRLAPPPHLDLDLA